MKQNKEHLLLLVHRIPYPPNKGDKIRSYHLLQHLCKTHIVHLGTFVDDENDIKYIETVKKLCGETYFSKLRPSFAKLASVTALVKNKALSLDYYRSPSMQTWVKTTIKKHAISKVMVFSSSMGQFVENIPGMLRIIDFVDIDSDKWEQYSAKKSWPMSYLYRREARTLLTYEKKLANMFDASYFVSQAESDLFKQLAPESAKKISYFNNGVDTDYFCPKTHYENPYSSSEKVIVFTGAMDYWPNIDAVQWFANEVFPSLLLQHPTAIFCIVGARPSEQVTQLDKLPGIRVTGTVPDVRPFIAHAHAAVAPLRIARGIQNKVLEAMAMEKIVVASKQALEGIDVIPGEGLLLAKNSECFTKILSELLKENHPGDAPIARHIVETKYNWAHNLSVLDSVLDNASSTAYAQKTS
ncbi:TIGR03087 family PEP-CTERM/XrtA system glycosyltransferase [Undibacterium sp. Ren11W]|uniref:TIGR03087 family PEP-CTERM/XrtA system glycosyltransferase n=1 Tax=Undibacterium sp. Ren11W TaxID=3413045 RepID=UPI003BF078EA